MKRALRPFLAFKQEFADLSWLSSRNLQRKQFISLKQIKRRRTECSLLSPANPKRRKQRDRGRTGQEPILDEFHRGGKWTPTALQWIEPRHLWEACCGTTSRRSKEWRALGDYSKRTCAKTKEASESDSFSSSRERQIEGVGAVPDQHIRVFLQREGG